MFIDTHCHLNFKAFEGGAKKIMARAVEAGVTQVVVPGTDVATSKIALQLAMENDNIYAVCGIHPHHVIAYVGSEDQIDSDIDQIDAMLKNNLVVGVGECGLDLHTYQESKYGPEIKVTPQVLELQKQVMIHQLELAIKHGKSLVLHNREASAHILDLLSNLGSQKLLKLANKCVFHCCEPEQKILDFCLAHNFYLGVDGDITYWQEKQEFYRQVPLTHIVLETDAPYILPEPHKTAKKYPNLPANIPLIAQKLAEIKGVSVEEVGQVTTTNAKQLFSLQIA